MQSYATDGKHLAIDGCKLSSNAAREWSGTHKDLMHRRDKIKARLDLILKELKAIDKKQSHRAKRLTQRIKCYENSSDRIESFTKNDVHDLANAVMKNKVTSHGILQGYNGIALVDGKRQIIFAAGAHGVGQEYGLLEPTLDLFINNAQNAGLPDDIPNKCKLLADANYFSEANLKMLDEQGINAFIPDKEYRKRDPRFKTTGRYKDRIGGRTRIKKKFTQQDFVYDPDLDCFICPAERQLKRTGASAYQRDQKVERYVARATDCSVCKLKPQCFKNPSAKRRNLSIRDKSNKPTFSAQMMKKMDSKAGRKIYSMRMGIVKPVFGNLTHNKNLNRFMLRTKEKVNT